MKEMVVDAKLINIKRWGISVFFVETIKNVLCKGSCLDFLIKTFYKNRTCMS